MNSQDDTNNDQAGDDAPTHQSSSGGNGSSTSSSNLVGLRLGDYQLLRKLGRGGMADVYAARHLKLARDVAIKVLRSDLARDQDYLSRFRREARAAAKLNHPNIVQVYDVGDVDSHHFIAQELIDGQNLREHLSSAGSLSADEAVDVLLAVGSALESAAELGITHRDIKPENIMRSSRGTIKVADFGLARMMSDVDSSRANLTQAGLTLGTPRYMSPEQVQGKNVDARSDLYSLGVSMYHLLTGRPPFEADDPIALAVSHVNDTPTPLDRARGKGDLPEWLIAVVTRLMSKSPDDRFQTPSDLLHAVRGQASIANFTGHGGGTAGATIRLQRASDSIAPRTKRTVAACGAALLLGTAAAGVGYWLVHRTPPVTVRGMLRPQEVSKADTVQQQYLLAITPRRSPGLGSHCPSPSADATVAARLRHQIAVAISAFVW